MLGRVSRIPAGILDLLQVWHPLLWSTDIFPVSALGQLPDLRMFFPYGNCLHNSQVSDAKGLGRYVTRSCEQSGLPAYWCAVGGAHTDRLDGERIHFRCLSEPRKGRAALHQETIGGRRSFGQFCHGRYNFLSIQGFRTGCWNSLAGDRLSSMIGDRHYCWRCWRSFRRVHCETPRRRVFASEDPQNED